MPHFHISKQRGMLAPEQQLIYHARKHVGVADPHEHAGAAWAGHTREESIQAVIDRRWQLLVALAIQQGREPQIHGCARCGALYGSRALLDRHHVAAAWYHRQQEQAQT
jgi:hypothetical protein